MGFEHVVELEFEPVERTLFVSSIELSVELLMRLAAASSNDSSPLIPSVFSNNDFLN